MNRPESVCYAWTVPHEVIIPLEASASAAESLPSCDGAGRCRVFAAAAGRASGGGPTQFQHGAGPGEGRPERAVRQWALLARLRVPPCQAPAAHRCHHLPGKQ